MAQKVGYWQDDVDYSDGPFVICSFFGKSRIEVECKGSRCPIVINSSIRALLLENGRTTEASNENVDWLNDQVVDDVIILSDHGCWIWPFYIQEIKNAP